MRKRAIVLSRRVESRILVLRGHRVILDADLAELYGVEVKRLNQQVKRNIDRFPGDFVLQLSSAEYESLRLQFATSNEGRGGRRYLPYAFRARCNHGSHGVEFPARHRDEHLCRARFRAHARSPGSKSADRGQTDRT